jgi:hypothetical protein
MPKQVHTIEIPDGGQPPTQSDRLKQYQLLGVANGVGGSAGAAVAVVVAVPIAAGLPASGNYFVDVELSQDATYYVTAKGNAGFTVNLLPRLAANTLAAGSFNVNVTY